MKSFSPICRQMPQSATYSSAAVRPYESRVFGFAYILLGHGQRAEEVTKATLDHVRRGLTRFDLNEASVSTWLYRTALNEARARYGDRQDARATESTGSFSRILNANARVPAESDKLSSVPVGRMVGLVANCLKDLSPQHRELLAMRYVLDLRYNEMAAVLRVRSNTVRARIIQVRQALREKLMNVADKASVLGGVGDFSGALTGNN